VVGERGRTSVLALTDVDEVAAVDSAVEGAIDAAAANWPYA
jgi:hypothetical protein